MNPRINIINEFTYLHERHTYRLLGEVIEKLLKQIAIYNLYPLSSKYTFNDRIINIILYRIVQDAS